MFYSQFILAKKGPLGTIWIAAHLERKLRKNQVTDTDIGDSVDSILSPDVPIALRLSSHLLFGVVRIYSRKVNYLFDDCSEALLKIKQAFRSAAVDLPPEESKAPYHSITLPETFDLDDFELPDNEIFHSNSVDHHVSSRDQITLQDPMEGVSYSTSRFGLDERFGDGDAFGLDLDEELFLDKIGTRGYANESADPQASAVSMNPVKQDEQPGTSNVNSQTRVDLDDDDNDSNFMDYAQAPCTPGLVDEPNLSNVQEVSACDNHLESEGHLLESTVTEKAKVIDVDKQEVDWCSGNSRKSDATPSYGTADDNGYRSDGMDINYLKQHEELPVEADMEHATVEPSSGSKQTSVLLDISLNPTSELVDKITEASHVSCTEGIQNGLENTDNNSSLTVDKPFDDHQSHHGVGFNEGTCEISTSTLEQVSEAFAPNHHGLLGADVPGSAETATNLEKSCCNLLGLSSENRPISFTLNSDILTPHSSSLNNDVHENVASTGKPFLLPCDSNMQQPDQGCGRSTEIRSDDAILATSMGDDAEIRSDDAILATSMGDEMLVQGKACGISHNPDEILKVNQIQDIHATARGTEIEAIKVDSHEMLVENQDISAEVELHAPEKLLSVPEGHVDQHCNMLLTESPAEILGLDEGDAGCNNISGKKRSVTESTLTEQSLNSVESSRVIKFTRTVESVPGDDDLLSSILVGRSSVLKVKPTPRLSEATSGKRTRLHPRATPKKKLLMDETMVLHGDMIRQQLTSTSEIRRVRKKAPCTLPEISVIQKQQLEDEIFLEPTCTGMSTQLSPLHSQMWDLKRIRVCKNEYDGGSLLMGFETGPPLENDRNDSRETLAQPSLFSHDIKSHEPPTAAELPLTSQNDDSQDTKIENDPGPRVLNAIERSTTGITREASLGDNEVAKHIENPLLSSSNLKEFSEINVDIEQIQATNHMEPNVSPQELLLDVDGIEKSHKDGDTLNYSVITGDKPLYSGDMLKTAAGVVQSGSITEARGTNPSVDTSAVQLKQMADVPSSELDAGVMYINNGLGINANTEKDGDIDTAVEINPALRDDFLSGMIGDGGTAELLSNVEHEHIPADLYPSDMGLGDGFMNNMENSEHLEEWKYSVNDTDFLNVDDDELTEADDPIPQDEQTQFTESTGWSSRTRAVSKYLQTMFVKEANHGRESLSVDNLLVGKSRKEASRMFFETLVLKTRDYIEVEQQNSYDDITIRPQMRLMKCEF